MQIRRVVFTALACTLFLGATAQTSRPSVRSTTAEYQLIGVRLYDTGQKVVKMFGSPDDILGLEQSTGGSAGPAGGGGGGLGRAGGGGGRSEGAGSSPGAGEMELGFTGPGMAGDPFNMGNTDWRQFRDGGREGGASAGEMSLPGGGGDNGPGGPGSAGGAGGGGAANSGTGNRVTLTRWIYKRPNAQYGFVFDKANRVVQIEALGYNDKRVKTRKGVGFGSTVQILIQKYGAPDAYEVGGQNIVLRFLVKDRVAFRLSRLKPKDKHRVTGVVVAAGKS